MKQRSLRTIRAFLFTRTVSWIRVGRVLLVAQIDFLRGLVGTVTFEAGLPSQSPLTFCIQHAAGCTSTRQCIPKSNQERTSIRCVRTRHGAPERVSVSILDKEMRDSECNTRNEGEEKEEGRGWKALSLITRGREHPHLRNCDWAERNPGRHAIGEDHAARLQSKGSYPTGFAQPRKTDDNVNTSKV